jgi:hypothetical protein
VNLGTATFLIGAVVFWHAAVTSPRGATSDGALTLTLCLALGFTALACFSALTA